MELGASASSSPPRSQTAAPPLVPTPPAEVFVRTMESDLRSFRASGGARPKPERIVVSGNAPKDDAPRPSFFASRGIDVKWLFIAGGAALALGAILVYGFSRVSLPLPLPGGSAAPAAVAEREEDSLEPDTLVAPSPEEEVVRTAPQRGILRKPADRTASFTATGFVHNVADLKTPNQRLGEVLAAVPPLAGGTGTSTLIEVVPVDAGGNRLPLASFLALQDIEVLPQEFVEAHFAEQFLMFAYRDAQGVLPGYVLTLRPGENWLFVKDDVAKLESSPKLVNLYLADPGEPDEEWGDARVGDLDVRELEWVPAVKSAKAPHPKFVYGWFRGYLILSTSVAGVEALLPRL